MKAEKKRLGTGAKFRALREKKRRTIIFLALILFTVVLLAYLSGTFLNLFQNQTNNATSELKAAIVDQASLSPAGGFNETFVERAKNIMKQAGYKVDYCPGEKVTVDFYRDLPTHGYALIVLRVHAGTNPEHEWVGFFSSELYSKTKYVGEQLTDRVVPTCYNYPPSEDDPKYFGITPLFVSSSMKGRFQNTTIIMTGCDGLEYSSMAAVFIQKGAKAYIGWNKGILFSFTDAATINLLGHLITEKQRITQAVENTMNEVGVDPYENALLTYYPNEAGDQKIEG